MTLNNEIITVNLRIHTHCCKHFENSLSSVAFLICETAYTIDSALALAESGQKGYDREKIRTIRRIDIECLQWCPLSSDISLLAVKLRKACTCIHKDIHNREICLKGGCIKSLQLYPTEKCTGHEEVCCRTPIAFKVDICCLIFLSTLYFEDHLCAERPISI